MAKSKIQQILSKATERNYEFGFVPVCFIAEKEELRIGDPLMSSEVDESDVSTMIRPSDVVYKGEDLTSRVGKESVKESLCDIAEGNDVRVFVFSSANRSNGKAMIFEYNPYFQFDKFLTNVSTFVKEHMKDKRVKFRPTCKTQTRILE